MSRRFGKRILQWNQDRKRKKWWHNLVVVLAMAVIFSTTYSLIMNAITLETSPDLDPACFMINGVELPGEFLWENEDTGLTVAATLHGNASYTGTLPKETSPELSVEFDDPEAVEWLENYEAEDISYPLMAFRLHLHVGDVELQLGQCQADVALTAKRELFSAAVMAIGDSLDDEAAPEEIPLALVATDSMEGQQQLASAELNGTDDPILTYSAAADAVTGVQAISNPSYTLQHFLNFPSVVTDKSNPEGATQGWKSIEFLNTSLGSPRDIPDSTGSRESLVMENSMHGDKVFSAFLNDDGSLKTTIIQERLFLDEETCYRLNPQINYMSRLYNGVEDYNSHYTLAQIWVYTPANEETPDAAIKDSKTSDRFAVYDVPQSPDGTHIPERIRFTNNPNNRHIQETGATAAYPYDRTILIPNNAIVRLVFDYTEENGVERGANFFDYDITDGHIYSAENRSNPISTSQQTDNQTWYAYTNQSGINSDGNYTDRANKAKLAFGNSNTKTGLENQTFKDNGTDIKINQLNRKGSWPSTDMNTYKGCAFGLVKGLTYGNNGLPIPKWSDSIRAPDLFSLGNATGKTAYQKYIGEGESAKLVQRYSLGFYRQGGTYTLSYVNDTENQTDASHVLSNLQQLKHPNEKETDILTNEFWPLDNSPSHGTDGHDLKFGRENLYGKRNYFGNANGNFPVTDSKKDDHNAYFGMSFTVDFVLEPGYCGPLAYWFYGDDDMWVFLDKLDSDGNSIEGQTKLIADIGGVHKSAGEYVNLWEYATQVGLDETDDATYRLTVFYTERGASGSTCYMRFTVPLKANDTDPPRRDEALVFEKVALDANGQPMPYSAGSQKYTFELTMVTEDGASYEDIYDYAVYDRATTPDHTADTAHAIRDGTIPKFPSPGGGNLTRDGTSDAGGDDAVTRYTFYLRNGEYIVISNLPENTYYTIKELRQEDESYVTQYQRGQHTHINGEQVDTLNPAIRYDHVVGNPERINSKEYNYIRFINGPVIKTEVLPGDGESVHIGQYIIYDIEWGNDTHKTADVVITDPLDEGLDFVGAKFVPSNEKTPERDKDWWNPADGDYSGEAGASITYDADTHTVTWKRVEQGSEASGLVSLKVKVNEKAIQPETVEGKFGTTSPRVENRAGVKIGNQNEIKTNVVENPVWGPFKTEPTPGDKAAVTEGEEIVYTITWRNYLKSVAQVRVRDPLDSAVSYVDGSAKAYYGTYGDETATELVNAEITYDQETHTLLWDLGEQLPDADGYVVFRVIVNADTPKTVIWNVGYVQVGNQPEIETNHISNPIYGYRLPDTGGHGRAPYTLAGLLLMGSAMLAFWHQRRKKPMA